MKKLKTTLLFAFQLPFLVHCFGQAPSHTILLPSGNFKSDYFFDSTANIVWFSFVADKPRITIEIDKPSTGVAIPIDSLILYSSPSGVLKRQAYSIAPNTHNDSTPAIQILSLIAGNTYYIKVTKFNTIIKSGSFSLSKTVLHPAIIPPSCSSFCTLENNLVCNGDFEVVPSWASGNCYADSSPTFPNNAPLVAATGYCISTPNVRNDNCSFFADADNCTDIYVIGNTMGGGDFQNAAENGSYFMGVDCPSTLCTNCSTVQTAGYIWTPNYTAIAWKQSVSVVNGRNYQFSCWLEDLDISAISYYPAATVSIVINNDTLFSDVISYANGYAAWQQVSFCWIATDSNAMIQILGIGNASSSGYDFGLDNILFYVSERAITFSSTVTNIICPGANNGSTTLNVSGGFPPYTYLWATSPVQTNSQATGLTVGTYTVTITDSIGCSLSTSVEIAQADFLQDSVSSGSASCCNCNGSTSLMVRGGVSPYTYLWSNNHTNDTLLGLSSGIYLVTVWDSNGCSLMDSVYVFEKDIDTISCTIGNPICYGSNTGSASVFVSGSFSYLWSPGGETNSSILGLSAGIYTVTLTNKDTAGCSASYVITITQPTQLNVSATESISNCRASATASATGGTLPYTYLWSPSGGTNNVATGLSAATYTVSVTDNNGCMVTGSVAITLPIAPTAIVNVNSNPCDLSYLSLQAVVSGGKTPYTYSWEYGSTLSSEGFYPVFSCPIPVTDYVVVTDNNGCSTTVNKSVSIPIEWSQIPYTITNATCYGENNGSITMNICDGTGNYFTYSWNVSSANSYNYSYTASNLSAGTYTINVTDFYFHCTTQTYTVTITQPPALIVSATVTSNVTCNIGNNGNATSTVSGGTLPYTYLWTGGGTNNSVNGLSAGIYTLNVTDHLGCISTATVTITEPSIIVTTSTTPFTCTSAGSATAFPSNGFPPYTYSWSNGGGTNAIAIGLSVGTYTVNVSDNNGCTGSAMAIITQPSQLTFSANILSNISCYGGNNGTITSTVSGGTSPYTYFWSNNATTTTITALMAGTYSLSITDNNGCTGSTSITITQPNVLSVLANVTANVGCNGDSNASAISIVSGGTSPYAYLWTGGGTNNSVNGLSAGVYTLSVIDSCGNSATSFVTITQPNLLQVSANIISNVSCDNGINGSASSSVSGGTSPYTYIWSNSASASSINALTAGNYSLNVTDNNGCTGTASINITQPPAIIILSDSVVDNGSCNGYAGVSVSGGTSPYTYLWTGGGTNDSIQNQCAGSYCCTVTDANGCIDSVCVTILLNLTTGINGITNKVSSKIYPDPNNGQFTLSISKGYSNSEIEIYDLVGREVYTTKINSAATQINLGNQADGMYFYKIITLSGSSIASGKFVVE